MPKKISKLISRPSWLPHRGSSVHPQWEEKLASLVEKIDRCTERGEELEASNARLRKALRECWKAARHSEAGDKITGIVVDALANQDQPRQS